MDPYADFAERYDLSFSQSAERNPQVVEFFRQLFDQNNVHTVLDCACGTGRYLTLFYSLGCQVWGSDISEAMLQQARLNQDRWELKFPLRQADFRQLPQSFERQFDAVICLAAISFMQSDADFLKAYQSMAQVLRPGGMLVLTAMPADRQWRERPRFILNSSRPELTRLFAIDYLEDRAHFNILDILHSGEDSELKVWSAELRPFLQDKQAELLKSAGFCSVDLYENYAFNPYNKETSNNLIAVAKT